MKVVVAILSAACVSVLVAVGLAYPCGGLNPLVAVAALGAGALTGVLTFGAVRRGNQPRPPAPKRPWEWVAIVIYTLFSLRAFCWLVFWSDGSIKYLSDNNFGDLSLHLTYINNLANGVPFWPENPIFQGAKLHYPIGVDVFNSLLKLAGVDVYRGLVCVGLACALITGVALYKWGRGFALAGFLCNGGLAGFQFFAHLHLADYQADVAWKSIPLAMFVTQRGLLYAIPAGLVLLCSWRARFFPGREKPEQPLPFPVEVLLYSTMPLFHLHTFIFLSFLLGSWIVVSGTRWNPAPQTATTAQLLKLVLCSVIPATLLIALITGFESGSVIHFIRGWNWQYDEQSQFATWAERFGLPHFFTSVLGHGACWIVNFGSFPFFVALLVQALVRNRRESAAGRAGAFVFPAVLIFIMACFVMFAKWDWDNTKIMIWSYMVVLPFLWNQFVAKENLMVRGVFCFLLFFSGFISLLGGIDNKHTGYDLATRSDVDGVASATRSLPVTAVFAAYPIHNHPLLLIGRNLVEGYDGHLDSYGIDYLGNLAKLDDLLNGELGWRQIAEHLHVRYVFWGKFEQEHFPDSTQPWKDDCMKVAEGPWGEIYDLTIPIPPVPDASQPRQN